MRYDPRVIEGKRQGAVRIQPAIWRTRDAPVAERRGSCDNAAQRRKKAKKRKMKTKTKKKKKTKSRGGGGRRGSDGGGRRRGGGGGEGERSSSVKHMTRTERTNRHSALRPRYTANMAAEGRIGGGQPRRQPMSS